MAMLFLIPKYAPKAHHQRFKILLALVPLLAGLGHSFAAETTLPPFTTVIAANHPLIGQIYDVRSGDAVSADQLADALVKADHVFLGEKHDNPDHHAVQAWAFDAMLAAGRRPALLYEMIGEDQQLAIETHRQSGQSMENLGEVLDWENSGWPDWAHYAPMAISADNLKLPILGANLPKALIRKVYTDGADALGADRAERLNLNKALPTPLADAMLDDVETGHCGLMPRKALGPMVMVQRARDSLMADNMLKAGQSADGAVLIAGNGHARKDHGVPWVIGQLNPGLSSLSLSLIEVQDDLINLDDYREMFGSSLPFDFVLFTPRANDRDYCAELKASMGKKEN